jgi:Leucine-rich repeat (LRR) protein
MPFFGKCGCTTSRGELEEINFLNYAHNNLIHVPEEIILHERTLEELYLDANRISELPRVSIFSSFFDSYSYFLLFIFLVAFSMLWFKNS